jgi:uncharacterized protein (TIGR02117 family)
MTAAPPPRRRVMRAAIARLVPLLLLAACSALSARPDPPTLPRPFRIAVIDRDWHTEIGLRAEDLDGPLAAVRDRFPGARTLVFGFGDRHYLAARDPGVGDMLLAALPAAGALLVTGLSTSPEEAFGAADVVRLRLSNDGARRAVAFIWNSFARGPSGAPVALGDGPYPGSLFYAATVTYALTHTCNTWTAEVLQEGGAAVSAEGVLFADQVMRRARAAER